MAVAPVIVLGVDPGLAACGWARVELVLGRKPLVLESGTWRTSPGPTLPARVARLAHLFGEVLTADDPTDRAPDAIGLEGWTYQGPERSRHLSAVQVARVIQAVREKATQAAPGVPVYELPTYEAKRAMGRRSKPTREDLALLVDGPVPTTQHARDAVAVAIAAARRHRLPAPLRATA